MKNTNQLLTARGIARHFGLPFDWVISEADAGRLPQLRIGRRLLFNVDAVREALLRAASQQPKELEP